MIGIFSKKIKKVSCELRPCCCNSAEKGLSYFHELSKKTVCRYAEIGHDLVELETYLYQLRFQIAELKAKLQLGESCQRLLNRKAEILCGEKNGPLT